MKYTGLLLALSIISPMALSQGQDYITGSCSSVLEGNDTTSNWATKGEQDNLVESFEESEVSSGQFTVQANTREVINHQFERVVPFWEDVNKYQHYQIAVFKTDNKSKNDAAAKGTGYKKLAIKGKVYLAVGYGGQNAISTKGTKSFLEAIDRAKKESSVWINIMGLGKQASTEKTTFDNNGEAEIEFKYIVPIEYKDYGGDGFWGSIFKGDITVEDAKKAGRQIHESEVTVKCNFKRYDPSQKDEDRNNGEVKEIKIKSGPRRGHHTRARVVAESSTNDSDDSDTLFTSEFSTSDGDNIN